MIGRQRAHAISGVFIFALLGAFAVLSTLLVLLGARAYRAVTERAALSAEERILLNYPLNKVRMNDCADRIRVDEKDGVPMLVIRHDIDGEWYETSIYCHQGWLYELFAAADDEIPLEEGEPLAAADYFKPELKDGVVSFEVGTGSGIYRAQVALRSRKGATA